jgi:hypothetical protein
MTQSVLLLVTWFVYGQPPQSYQQEFSSLQTCEAARDQLMREGERLKAETRQQDADRAAQARVFIMPSIPPSVTAVCTPR